MTREEFESLDNAEKRHFVLTQNPTIRRYVSVTAKEKELGEYHYAYRLDTGWKCCMASSIDEVKAKFETLYI